MQHSVFRIFFGLMTLTLMACGGSKPNNEYETDGFKSIQDEINKHSFICKDNSDCPNNVGLQLAVSKRGHNTTDLQFCTGFLVAHNIVATNSHCISDRTKNTPSLCSSDVAIRFLVNGQSKTFTCTELLDASEIDSYGHDYAFFKINSTGLKPIEINKNGLQDGQVLITPKVNPPQQFGPAVLTVETCRSTFGSIINPVAMSSHSISGTMSGCSVIKGNSGSPVLNSDRQVVGILQAKIPKDYSTFSRFWSKAKELGFMQPLMSFQLPDLSFFSNFACLRDPVTNSFDSQKCELSSKLSVSGCIKLQIGKQLEKKLNAIEITQNSPMSSNLSDFAKYEFEINMNSSKRVEFRMTCLHSKHLDKSETIHLHLSGWSHGFDLQIPVDSVYRPLTPVAELRPTLNPVNSTQTLKWSSDRNAWISIRGEPIKDCDELQTDIPKSMFTFKMTTPEQVIQEPGLLHLQQQCQYLNKITHKL